MATREQDIVFDAGDAWVLKKRDAYVVFKTHLTHSESDSAYALDGDGLSLAIARATYLARRIANGRKA